MSAASPTATGTTLTSAPNPAASGSQASFTATVTPQQDNSETQTGSVIFNIDGSTAAAKTLGSSGRASYTPHSLSVGDHTIRAIYSGDSNFGTSSSAPLIETIEVQADTPSFSVAAGNYTDAQTVTISDTTPSASIYYTIISQSTPTITWPTPAPIDSGTVLSSTQLNATASVPGTFVYNPAAGTTPAVGNDTLSVTFTPTDATDYTTATASVTLVVNIPSNPAPSITSMSPAFASAGGTVFTLIFNGTGFVSGSTVYWGSTALSTQFVSATQLTAQVTAAGIANAGITAVTVKSPATGGGTSKAFQFEVDTAGSSSTPPTFVSLTASVAAGSAATYFVTFHWSVTSVSVTCLNLPSGATCAYSSTTNSVTITTSSTTPVGTYQVTVIFTETVTGAASGLILLPFLLLPLTFGRKGLATRGVWITTCLGLVLLASVAVACVECGGGVGGPSSTPISQTHQVVSSGTVTLTIQ